MARLSGFRLAVLAMVALTVGVGVPPASELSACSLMSPWGIPIRAQSLYFLGVATSDSIAAPVTPGAMAPGETPRTYLIPESAEGLGVRGQVVEVITPLQRGDGGPGDLLAGHDRVIVVWWEYSAACEPRLWARSSILHAEPGIENVFEGTLVHPDHWVEGTPVINVHRPYHTPFPGVEHRYVQRAVEAGRPVEEVERDHLSARELFEFLTRMPVLPEGEPSDPQWSARVYGALIDWARDHPERWEAQPVGEMVRYAWERVHAAVPVEEAHPAAGTYRINVQVRDEAGEVCVRMVPSPVDRHPADYEEYAPPPWADTVPVVAAMRIEAAASCDAPAEAWRGFPPFDSALDQKSRIWIRWTAEEGTAPGEARVWRGALTPASFSQVLRGTGVVEPPPPGHLAVHRDEPPLPPGVWRSGTAALTTARFVLHDDGRMTVTDDRGGGRVVFRVTGERVAR